MGLNEAQKKERAEYLEKYLEITECSQRKPYVFISYASDNWEMVFKSAVVPLQKQYGLRVYADKAFDKVNDKWIVPMLRNVRGADMMVAFISQSYIESYACFLELLTAVNNRRQIVFVSLGDELHLGDTTDQPNIERGVKSEILNQGANIATNTNNTSNDVMRAMKSAFTSLSTLLEQDALSKYDISDAFINFFRDASVNEKTINDLRAVKGTINSISSNVFDKLLITEPEPTPQPPEPQTISVPKPASADRKPEPQAASVPKPASVDQKTEPQAASVQKPVSADRKPEPQAAPVQKPASADRKPEPQAAPAQKPASADQKPEQQAVPAQKLVSTDRKPEPQAVPAQKPISADRKPEPQAAPAQKPASVNRQSGHETVQSSSSGSDKAGVFLAKLIKFKDQSVKFKVSVISVLIVLLVIVTVIHLLKYTAIALFFVNLIVFIIRIFKRKPKKTPVIGMLVSIVLYLCGVKLFP